MEGGEWKVEVEVGCPPWASVLKLAYCSTAKGAPVAQLVRASD